MGNIININFHGLSKPPANFPLSRPTNRTLIPQLVSFRLQHMGFFLDAIINRFSQSYEHPDIRNISNSELLWRWSGIPSGEKSKWLDSAVRSKEKFEWKL